MGTNWRKGFLFVGNHLALDFLNTHPIVDGQAKEMLSDCRALARWLAAAGLISQPRSAQLMRRWSDQKFVPALQELLKLREDLRKAVFHIENSDSARAGFLRRLNRLLIDHPWADEVVDAESGLERRKRFAPEVPEDVFAPIADAIADLLTNTTRSRIRKCRNCVVHFYDTSKKGTRVWCSMDLCGNRAKVAAYAERKTPTGAT